MSSFVVYYESSGEITREVTCPEDVIASQIGEGEAYLPGSGMFLTHKVVDGEVVQLDPPRDPPSASRFFDFHTGTWFDPREFETKKADKWVLIKATRETKIAEPLDVDGNVFDADPVSQTKIQGAVILAQALGAAYTVEWTLADNSVVTLTSEQMVATGVALGARTSALYTHARALRALIENAETVAELDAVVW